MDEELLRLLTDSAGSADEMARIQQQMLRAKDLRAQANQDPRRTTRQGGMFSALARGVGAYQAGQLERQAGEAQAGMAARNKAVAQRLPSIGGLDAVDVYAAPDDEAAAGAAREAMLRGEKSADLARRLSLAGMGSFAEPYSADAAAQAKGVPQAINAREQRALTRSLAEMKDRTARDLSTPNTGAYTPEKGGYMLDRHTGKYVLLPADPAAVEAAAAARAAHGSGRDIVVLTGPGGEQYRYNKVAGGMPEPIPTPQEPTPALPGATRPFTKGAPADVQKLTADLAFVQKMPEDVALLEKYAGKDVPGMGPLAGLAPDWATSAEGNEARQAAMRLMNALVYMSSGKQINEQEMKRLLISRGLGPTASSAAFTSGVRQLKGELSQAAQKFVQSRPPGVVKLAQEQGVLRGLEPFLGPSIPTGPAAPQGLGAPRADGKVRIKRGGQTGWVLPADIKPGDERL